MTNRIEQVQFVTQAELDRSQGVTRQAIFDADGNPVEFPLTPTEPFVPAEAVEDSEAETVEELVSDFNGLLENLRDAGIIKSE